MIHESLGWLQQSTGGKLIGSAENQFQGVSTDTRQLQKGELFFCLQGQSDGHAFAENAADLGAAAIIVDETHPQVALKLQSRVPLLVVPDTLKALGDLAQAWRKKFHIPVLALTGSNGKTTTKELIRKVLEFGGFSILATQGNLNNLIGVPKMLFQLADHHQIAVLEMGMNDFGEIARLTEIAKPNLALITNIGAAHLEKLGGLEGIAQAKGELFLGLDAQAIAWVNAADARILALPTSAQKFFFGTRESRIWGELLSADITDSDSSGTSPAAVNFLWMIHYQDETFELSMRLPGEHQIFNILAAIVVGRHFKIPFEKIRQALEAFEAPPSRMQWLVLPSGKQVLDDCYNANPTSMKAGLKTLAKIKKTGKSLAVIGEMRELGDFREAAHLEVGAEAAAQKTDFMIAIGESAPLVLQGAQQQGMPPSQGASFADVESALPKLQQIAQQCSWILVKGSRAAHLEKIVQFLKEKF